MGLEDVQEYCYGRAPGVAAVGAGTRLSVGCEDAASHGHLEVLLWAMEQGSPWRQGPMCELAALGRNLAVLQWAREQGCSWDEWDEWVPPLRAVTWRC